MPLSISSIQKESTTTVTTSNSNDQKQTPPACEDQYTTFAAAIPLASARGLNPTRALLCFVLLVHPRSEPQCGEILCTCSSPDSSKFREALLSFCKRSFHVVVDSLIELIQNFCHDTHNHLVPPVMLIAIVPARRRARDLLLVPRSIR